jgi:hypothetical protein
VTWPARLALLAAAFLVAVAVVGLVGGRTGRIVLAGALVVAGIGLVTVARRQEGR